MTKVITGKSILEEVRKVCKADGKIILAVSYWGKGAFKALGLGSDTDKASIVLNVEHGGTNPEELKTLMKALPKSVRVHPTLHAKIYSSEKRAVIGSANASASGLKLGGSIGHAEAAVVLESTDAKDALNLTENFYKEGKEATEGDIETFMRRPDVFGPLPVIISDGKVAPNDIAEDWKVQQLKQMSCPAKDHTIPRIGIINNVNWTISTAENSA